MSVDRPSTFTFDIEEIQKTVIRKILQSRKYQALDIPEDTIMQLGQME